MTPNTSRRVPDRESARTTIADQLYSAREKVRAATVAPYHPELLGLDSCYETIPIETELLSRMLKNTGSVDDLALQLNGCSCGIRGP